MEIRGEDTVSHQPHSPKSKFYGTRRTNLPPLNPLHPPPNLVHMHAFLSRLAQDLGHVRGFHEAEAGGEVILFLFVRVVG